MSLSDLKSSPLQVVGVIPARLASTRLPGKVLREVAGQPLLSWVHQAAAQSQVFDRLIVAVDSEEVERLCHAQNWEFRMTSPELSSGTDRVHAVARQLSEEDAPIRSDSVFVNIQGDEPLLRPEHFHALLRPFTRSDAEEEVEVSTVMTPCPVGDVENPNVVKVVVDRRGRALYFSRAPIPWNRDRRDDVPYWKHLGLYAYRKRILEMFPDLPASRLEATERLEQLRLVENGIPVHIERVKYDSIGVDTEADLEAVEDLLTRRIQGLPIH